jgi:hypothetical protein
MLQKLSALALHSATTRRTTCTSFIARPSHSRLSVLGNASKHGCKRIIVAYKIKGRGLVPNTVQQIPSEMTCGTLFRCYEERSQNHSSRPARLPSSSLLRFCSDETRTQKKALIQIKSRLLRRGVRDPRMASPRHVSAGSGESPPPLSQVY